ncbi:MAG: AI-2E family transporter [Alphaproteobacteria bacterium]|nr:AI-2E family transporter [Alphaproteobacteria bacterium]
MSISTTGRSRLITLIFWATVIALFIVFLQSIRPILLPFVVGMMVAYLFDPLVDRLERAKFSRICATATVTVTFFVALASIIMWLGPLLYHQLAGVLTSIPDLLREAQLAMKHHGAPILELLGQKGDIQSSELAQQTLAAATDVLKSVMVSSAAALNLASMLLITPIVCFYLLRDWDKMVASIDRLLPRAHAATIREQVVLIDSTLSGYLRGQVLVMVMLTIYYALTLSIIGIPFSLILALIAGLFIIIPYVGTLVSTVLAVGISYMHFGLEWQTLSVIGIYMVGQILESQILTPKVIGDRVGLHPLWMVFGMLAGAVLLGFAGVLLAVPITAVIGVLVRFAVGRYLECPFYTTV